MSLSNQLLSKILIIPAILIGLTFHEYAHALVADRLGDKTPKFQGRLTLNPIAHIDILGFLMILLVGFGWAKPVETNPSAYKKYYKDDLKVSIAGPLANLLVAFIFAIFTGLLYKVFGNSLTSSNLVYVLREIFTACISINCMLFLFNIMPIPGLDGFHILRDLFPKAFYKYADFAYQYQMVILIVFIVFLAKYLVGIPSVMLYYSFLKLAAMIV
ncbi:peptidase family M50 [Clostridium acetireducens DSM 10703]|uniref:Peptidase family M50 n=1 Tax=Clostridium acetireducens DSM 10703 TaxID=1121290 RepID=A0A1E8F0S9_9CLOT|nr:site-2 protease family protein [Clostridium acetireducens]OFI07026.1 peptidase family M50 [Clostridium acetireducens DSM 10703]